MARTFRHVFTVFVLCATICDCVNSLVIVRNIKRTSSEKLRVNTRVKRETYENDSCPVGKYFDGHKCQSQKEKPKNETTDYEDFNSKEILIKVETKEVVEDNVTYNIKTSELTTFETTTHEKVTTVSSSTVTKKVHTAPQFHTKAATSMSTTRVPGEIHKHRASKNRTRNYELLTTKIVYVTDTRQMVGDKVTNIKPTTFRTIHHEATQNPPSSVTVATTSKPTTRIPDEFNKWGMTISSLWWIIGCTLVTAFCILVGYILYQFYLRRNRVSMSYVLNESEKNNDELDAAMPLKTSEC